MICSLVEHKHQFVILNISKFQHNLYLHVTHLGRGGHIDSDLHARTSTLKKCYMQVFQPSVKRHPKQVFWGHFLYPKHSTSIFPFFSYFNTLNKLCTSIQFSYPIR